MNPKSWIEIAALGIMLVGVAGLLVTRWKPGKGIGRRFIQATSIVLVVPTTLVLGLENTLSSDTVAAILGSVIGYALGMGGKETDA